MSAGAGEKKAERAADVPAVELTDAAREAGVTVNPRDAKGITLPTPKPWRRFWARNFDICLLGLSALIIGVLSGAVTKFEVWGLLGSLKLNLILPLAWVFLEASLLMLIGTTPGKFLLGVRIQTIGGAQKLNLRQALARSMGVWWRGWGLGFPFVMLLSLAFSHYNLKTTRTTPWDAQQGTIVSYETIKPWRILALAFLVVGLSQLLVSLAGPPPEAFWPARGASAS